MPKYYQIFRTSTNPPTPKYSNLHLKKLKPALSDIKNTVAI